MNEDFADVVKYVEDRKGHDFRYALDDEWTQGVLGRREKINFRVGLEKTIDWYTSNPEWWKPLVKK
jgi:dTDP-glucose 4,6-dehydratase